MSLPLATPLLIAMCVYSLLLSPPEIVYSRFGLPAASANCQASYDWPALTVYAPYSDNRYATCTCQRLLQAVSFNDAHSNKHCIGWLECPVHTRTAVLQFENNMSFHTPSVHMAFSQLRNPHKYAANTPWSDIMLETKTCTNQGR